MNKVLAWTCLSFIQIMELFGMDAKSETDRVLDILLA